MFASPGAIAFQLGPFVVRWYGILTAAAIVVGLWLVGRQARAEGLPEEKISSCVMWGIVTGYIGAPREVAFNGTTTAAIGPGSPPWEELAVRRLLVVVGPTAAWRRLPGPGHRSACPRGRSGHRALGNFFEEAFGRPTDLPWRLYIAGTSRWLPGCEFFH
jgi:phosphatidylglycerol:prolipoprotein diacylglycerol transferase